MAKVAASREAFLPLFVGDFLGATAEWAGEEQALYLLALAYQWSIGSLPADSAKLCRLFRWDRKAFDRAWPQVAEKFAQADGRLVNARLEQHRSRVHEISKKRSAAGAAGGKSNRQTDSKCEANASELLEQKESPAKASIPNQPIVSEPSVPQPRARRAAAVPAEPAPPGLNLAAWADWERYRASIGKPIKPASVGAAQRKLAGFGAQQAAVVEQSIAQGWQGLFALDEPRNPAAPRPPPVSAVDRVRQATGVDLRTFGVASPDPQAAPSLRVIGAGNG